MITIKSKRDIEKLKKSNDVKEVYLKGRISKSTVVSLLNKFKNLKKIYNPSCYYKKTSKKILNALNKIGVEVIETKKRGRRRKLDWNRVVEMYKKGMSIKSIADSFKVQRKTIYYILKKMGLK